MAFLDFFHMTQPGKRPWERGYLLVDAILLWSVVKMWKNIYPDLDHAQPLVIEEVRKFPMVQQLYFQAFLLPEYGIHSPASDWKISFTQYLLKYFCLLFFPWLWISSGQIDIHVLHSTHVNNYASNYVFTRQRKLANSGTAQQVFEWGRGVGAKEGRVDDIWGCMLGIF